MELPSTIFGSRLPAARVRTPVKVRLPAPSTYDLFAIRPDSRAIYDDGARAEADIWILERK